MIVFDYIYYCAYCLTTVKRSEKGAHLRALVFISLILVFVTFSIVNIVGVGSVLRKNGMGAAFLSYVFWLLFSFQYFQKSNRNGAIVTRFDQSIGEWKNLHAFNGFLLFVGGMILFWYTKTHYDEIGRTILPFTLSPSSPH